MPVMSYDPRTGKNNGSVPESSPDEVDQVVRAAANAAGDVAVVSPSTRQAWLHSVADALEAHTEELSELADRETALGMTRLTGEVVRAANQLRFYAEVAAEGSYLRATVDDRTDTTPALARINQPVGPVGVFGASNFPFAFSVVGNDTGSAIAAGCPAVVKGHPAHPLLSRRLGELARDALAAAGAPDGTFGIVSGYEAGLLLVKHPDIRAVAFTGSQAGGLALWRAANEREVVIPVFAEMGTVNPVVVTRSGGQRIGDIAAGFVGSFTLGMGQFCTKPGLLLAPAGHDAAAEVARALRIAAPTGHLLTAGIAASAARGLDALLAAGAQVVDTVGAPADGWAAPAVVLSTPLRELRAGSRLTEECFGPVALVAEYENMSELADAVDQLQGALAGSVMTGGEGDPDVAATVGLLAPKVGRVAVNDWPTGVAFTWAQHHGGPWPSTTAPFATSVGAAALDRFVRPVTYQSVPDPALPLALRSDNPWSLPRRVNGVLEPSTEVR